MYRDEYLVDESDYSVDESTVTYQTNNSNYKKQKKVLNDAKKADKGFYSIKKNINNNKTKIELYSSGNSIGRKIRDPIYGNYMNDRIGSSSEYNYFKVRYTGLNSIEPVTLFYDSPEHYERHFKDTLPMSIKKKWADERNLELQNQSSEPNNEQENMDE